jgi:hypothetical protein
MHKFIDPYKNASLCCAYYDASPRPHAPTDYGEEWWEIYYGDIHAETISERTGNPFGTEPWEWRCGFYPGSPIRASAPAVNQRQTGYLPLPSLDSRNSEA